MSSASPRYASIESAVQSVIKNLSGRNIGSADSASSFFDLGFDSLLLTQASQQFRQKFGVKITFRQLMENLVTVESVARYLDEHLPAGSFAAPPSAPVVPVAPPPPVPPAPVSISASDAAPDLGLIDRIIKEQLRVMNQQLDLLRASGTSSSAGPEAASPPVQPPPAPVKNNGCSVPASTDSTPRYFGPYKPLDRGSKGGLTERQQAHLDQLIRDYVARTPRSKEYTRRHRGHFADPRTIAGFRQNWKEMVYPIVVKRSEGSRFWDIDGHEYIDLTMGFGTNLFGHSPGFLTRALAHQLKRGVEVGPQSAIAGKVASLLCELTGMERAAFCSTGSEAVLAAVRLARTVTGRTRIATMSGYHGINDEVLVRAQTVDGARSPAPIAPGIPQHSVSEVLVLDYGTPESLELLRRHAHELAAVLVEPVQSRRPDLQPVDFLREVRKITAESETVLVFDEIITGFRSHPGGTQALFGIQADLATYGKIIGGGMPIGALCGKARYMDALDGGAWQYGDDSSPETGMTFFAGTYVRHPLAVRAALSVLTRLKREGPALQEKLNARTARFAGELNAYFEREQVPMRATWFSSMLYFVFQQEFKHSSLLFFHLRLKGLHIWEGRPIFLSTAHTDEELAFIITAFQQSLTELRAGGFLPAPEASPSARPKSAPTQGQKLQYSLYFFGNYEASYRDDKYTLLQEAAQFADQNGFTALWLPERHFHSVGGFSPNSALLACALAPMTTRLQLRGGSVVLPLHHPVRVAEEWSVADNLSHGRTAISIATGWHPNDFVFAPESYQDRRNICLRNLEVVQRLWRGDSVAMPTPSGDTLPVKLHPLPRQSELPIWLTCIHKESYAEAGRKGMNVLGYLMNQTVDELAEKIAAYREGRRSAGLDPAAGHVTTLLFTYLDESVAKAQDVARTPLCRYLRSYLDNSQKKIEQQMGDVKVDEEDLDYLTTRSCDDYFNGKSLIGTPESCAPLINRLREIGVNEIGCFVDFGVEPSKVLESLRRTSDLLAVEEKVPSNEGDVTLPLTQAEQGLWLLGTLHPDAARAYRESVTLDFSGKLDRAILSQALQQVVDRHGALRTVIDPEGQTQTILQQSKIELGFTDLSHLPARSSRKEAERTLAQIEAQTFPELRGPFFLAHLIQLETAKHLLLLTFHHVVGNGPSYWVFLEELAVIYGNLIPKKAMTLPAPFTFSEFVQKRVLYLDSAECREAEKFWETQMQGGVPTLDLPYDSALSTELTYLGARQEVRLDSSLIRNLKKISSAHRCSLFMIMLSAYGVLLHRLTGQDDLIMGAPFDSPIRTEEAGRSLFANTTNMLPLRSQMQQGSSFLEYLFQMKSLVLAASEHQDYFFGNLIAKLNLVRNPSRAPLFNVVFNFEAGEFRKEFPELTMSLETAGVPYRGPRGTAMFDLYLNAAEQADGVILLQCDHNTTLISRETMQRWLSHFEALLQGIAADPERAVSEIPLFSEQIYSDVPVPKLSLSPTASVPL